MALLSAFCSRISADGLLECLHVVAYPKRKLDGGTAEQSLRFAAHCVALATDDVADLPLFVWHIFWCHVHLRC